jgi:hypothetical protein
VLGVIVANALSKVESGELSARQAIVHAAVHAWYEGHIEGEDACDGCSRSSIVETWTREEMSPPIHRSRQAEYVTGSVVTGIGQVPRYVTGMIQCPGSPLT